ncbi:MAG: nodulation protein NfeD [Parabacteroides sp.]
MVLFLLAWNGLQAEENRRQTVYTIPIKEEITHTTRLYLAHGLEEANELGAAAVLIDLNTYGGLVEAADSMRTQILYSPIPVYVFINNNAASAGALISIACQKIYMRKGANIGAATVVNQSGSAMPDKYQSYMRSMMRATAEAHGRDTLVQQGDTVLKWRRDPLIAEAMVDERVIVPHLVDSGKVLTFTAEEAIQWGYCDGLAETTDEIITRYLGFSSYELKGYTPSGVDRIKGFLLSPALQAILIMIIIGGIYFELQTPGIGFPSLASLVAAILYFAPLYIDGLAQNWEILLFLSGLVLLALEIFVFPGFGVAGIAGIACLFAGLTIGLVDNSDFDFGHVPGAAIGRAATTVLAGLVMGFVLVLWLSHKIGSRGLFRKVALEADLEQAVSTPDYQALVGQCGTALTVLRPSGKVQIGGKSYDAVSESGFVEAGSAVRVERYENAQLYVVPQENLV